MNTIETGNSPDNNTTGVLKISTRGIVREVEPTLDKAAAL